MHVLLSPDTPPRTLSISAGPVIAFARRLSSWAVVPGVPHAVAFEARLLDLPLLHLRAVWLAAPGGNDDRLIFAPPTPKPLESDVALPAASALARLRPLA